MEVVVKIHELGQNKLLRMRVKIDFMSLCEVGPGSSLLDEMCFNMFSIGAGWTGRFYIESVIYLAIRCTKGCVVY